VRAAGVRCWSFCPPGGLLSTNLSAAVAPFVTSVVVGKDVVPRVSIVNLGRLIDEMARPRPRPRAARAHAQLEPARLRGWPVRSALGAAGQSESSPRARQRPAAWGSQAPAPCTPV